MNEIIYAVGCYLDGSCDSCESLAKALFEFVDRATASNYVGEYETTPEDERSEIENDMVWDALDRLNDETDTQRPAATFWEIEDNSLFLTPSLERAKELVEDQELAPYIGEDSPPSVYWLHVNDHGNTALYCRDEDGDHEIWSLV